jgi:hypothetical protein
MCELHIIMCAIVYVQHATGKSSVVRVLGSCICPPCPPCSPLQQCSASGPLSPSLLHFLQYEPHQYHHHRKCLLALKLPAAAAARELLHQVPQTAVLERSCGNLKGGDLGGCCHQLCARESNEREDVHE